MSVFHLITKTSKTDDTHGPMHVHMYIHTHRTQKGMHAASIYATSRKSHEGIHRRMIHACHEHTLIHNHSHSHTKKVCDVCINKCTRILIHHTDACLYKHSVIHHVHMHVHTGTYRNFMIFETLSLAL